MDEIDVNDLFGSYTRAHERRTQRVREWEQGEMSLNLRPREKFEQNVPAIDAESSFVSNFTEPLGRSSFDVSSSAHHRTLAGSTRSNKTSHTPIPISIDGKTDLLNLIIKKTVKPYENPSLCMTERVSLLSASS